MLDPRYTKLADLLINYSCAVQARGNVLIEAIDVPHEFTSRSWCGCARRRGAAAGDAQEQ